MGIRSRSSGEPYRGNFDSDGEQAESETLTQDASIDPDTMKPLSRRQRRAKKKEADKHGATTKSMKRPSTSSSSSDPKKVSKWRNDMLAMIQRVHHQVYYRGGTPPSPPTWNYARDDLRAFQKWQRKVEIWQLQVSSYVPPNEAAMLLYVSLRVTFRRSIRMTVFNTLYML